MAMVAAEPEASSGALERGDPRKTTGRMPTQPQTLRGATASGTAKIMGRMLVLPQASCWAHSAPGPTGTRPTVAGLKGRKILAQGNALGIKELHNSDPP